MEHCFLLPEPREKVTTSSREVWDLILTNLPPLSGRGISSGDHAKLRPALFPGPPPHYGNSM